ncbi:MFS transporter [Actinoplanes oblitus]|uniref:MFS transporter n=1 Tax=Actinoplanes oblitus TaxID=3040509 RepID=A0ABY8WS48_9ACTN|nr:MFS transporter [Actinoplanes oblitus]WIM99826.1 MFS transporter [Actinoplanes oblitus]
MSSRSVRSAPPARVLPRGPGVVLFGTAGFVNALGMGFFYPFSLLFYTSLSGVPLRAVGAVLTVTALAVLPALHLVGRLVDRVGPQPVLAAAGVVRALCFLGFVAIPGLVPLAVFSFLLALATRADNAAAPLLAYRLAPEEQTSQWLALSRVVFNAGIGLGALIASVFIVDTAQGFAVLGLIYASALALTAALYFATRRVPARDRAPAGPARSRPAGPWRHRAFMRVALANALLLTAALAVETGMPVFVLDTLALPAWTVGVLFATNTALLAVLQLPLSRVLDRLRPAVVLALGGLAYAGLYAALLAAGGTPPGLRVVVLVAGVAAYTLGELAVSQAALVMLTGLPPDREKGAYLAFNQLFVGGATALSPLLVTSLLSRAPAMLWWALTALSVLTALLMLPALRPDRRPAGPE